MEYKVVTCDEGDMTTSLADEVNRTIKEGFEPIGGIAIRHGSVSGAHLLQAMIKRDHEKET